MLAAWPPTTDPEIQKRYKLYQEIQATADWIMMASVWSITIKVRPVILETSYQIIKNLRNTYYFKFSCVNKDEC